MRKPRSALATPASRMTALLVAFGLAVSACAGDDPTSSNTTSNTDPPATATTLTTAPATTTPSPETTTSASVTTGAESQELDVAEKLGCSDIESGPNLVESDSVVQCVTEFASDTLIVFFDSDDQRDRYLGYFQPTSSIVGPGWMVTTAANPFTDADQVALAVDGIVIKRAVETASDTPDPPANEGQTGLTSEDAWNAFDDALGFAQSGDPQEAIPVFNLVIASTDQMPNEAVLRSAALVNRGIAYENLMADHPNWNQEDLGTEVILSYQWLLDEFGELENADVRPSVVQGALALGLFLGNRQSLDEAIEAFNQAIQAGGDSADPDVECGVSDAMFNKAVALNLLDQTDAAIQGLEELLDTFSDSTVPCVTAVVSDATTALEQAR